MPAGQPDASLNRCIAGLRALALRRHAYYLDLLQSGRWRHYYFDEQQFAERLRDVMASTRTWNGLAEAAETQAPQTRPAA